MSYQLRQNLTIIITFLLAMLLSIVPLPVWFMEISPQWVWAVIIFWLTYTPQKIGPGIAWCIGLYMDLLLGTVLGEHALLFVLVAYVIQRFLAVVLAIPFWQKMLGLGVVTLISILMQQVFSQLMGVAEFHGLLLWSVLTTMLVWPLLYLFSRNSKAAYNYQLTQFW